MKLARDRARVVDIGKTRLDLPWNAYYDKELDVRFSRSYGPGRYDDRYELEGIDYPAGYVRWTERRNLECFLDLLAHQEIEVETLVTGTFPVDRGQQPCTPIWPPVRIPAVGCPAGIPGPPRRTARHGTPEPGGPGRWPGCCPQDGRRAAGGRLHRRRQLCLLDAAAAPGPAGDVRLAHVATNRSLSAANAQRRFGFGTVSTSARCRPGGRVAGRDLHRDAASHPCGPGLPCARDRQGGFRREAARAHPRGTRSRPRDRGEDRQ